MTKVWRETIYLGCFPCLYPEGRSHSRILVWVHIRMLHDESCDLQRHGVSVKIMELPNLLKIVQMDASQVGNLVDFIRLYGSLRFETQLKGFLVEGFLDAMAAMLHELKVKDLARWCPHCWSHAEKHHSRIEGDASWKESIVKIALSVKSSK